MASFRNKPFALHIIISNNITHYKLGNGECQSMVGMSDSLNSQFKLQLQQAINFDR